MAKYYIVKGLSLEAGPVLGILLSAEQDVYDTESDTYVTGNTTENFKNIDAAVALGVSYRLNLGIFFSMRFNKGLVNVNDRDDKDFKIQNNVFQTSVGYSF